MRMIAESTYFCGDPGMQYDTTINDWHTCSNTARINASNPCSEYMHLDNSACNLASLNLLKYLREDGVFDTEAFRRAVDIVIFAQDILVDNSSYPTAEITANAHAFRELGLGYANLGALLMTLGLPYDSDAGRAYAAAVTALMSGEGYLQSSRSRGGNRHVRRLRGQPPADAARAQQTSISGVQDLDLACAARSAHRGARSLGSNLRAKRRSIGVKNSQISVLAPTGTIAFMMDCDTTGVEPDIALIKYKKLVGGGLLKIVNNTVPRALKRLGYDIKQIQDIVEYIEEHETIEGAPHLKDDDLPVFDCAFKPANGSRTIQYMGHVKMMGAVQPFISGAISKTINMPTDATVEDIMHAYMESWKLGLKAVAIYRDGSKRTQPLNTAKDKEEKKGAAEKQGTAAVAPPAARRAPLDHPQVRHRRPRGLHHRRHVRRRPARRDFHHHVEGRLDHLRFDGLLRHGDLDRAAIRRAAARLGRQVQPYALRALGFHQESRHSDGQVDHGLHFPLAGRASFSTAKRSRSRHHAEARAGRRTAQPNKKQ